MLNKEDLIKIDLKNSVKEFCDSQENCILCELVQKELITNGYDQPCEAVYDLLRIIQNK